MSITAATLIGALAILAGSLIGAVTTGWVLGDRAPVSVSLIDRKENSMPIYVCSAATGRLTPVQKTQIARSITDIYHEVTGTARYFVRVMFQDVAPGNNYIAGRPAPADLISIRCDTRSGKTNEQKSQMLRRIMRDVATASGAAEDMVWVQLSESPAANFAEWGRIVPSPGEEDAWFS